MNTAVGTGLRITVTAIVGILLAKLLFVHLFPIPGLKDAISAV
jgi:hypothetical protein